jgi:hypothetical protein
VAEQWLTYHQAGELLGMTSEAARQRARRLRWRSQKGNDGKALVLVPEDHAVRPRVRPTVQAGGRRRAFVQDVQTADQHPDLVGELAATRTLTVALQAQLDRAHADLQAEREDHRLTREKGAADLEALRVRHSVDVQWYRDLLARPWWQRLLGR